MSSKGRVEIRLNRQQQPLSLATSKRLHNVIREYRCYSGPVARLSERRRSSVVNCTRRWRPEQGSWGLTRPSRHQPDVVVVVVVRGRTCSGGTGLGELAGNAAVWERLTDIRFRPTGNPARLARPLLSPSPLHPSRRLRRTRARRSHPSPPSISHEWERFSEGRTHTHTHAHWNHESITFLNETSSLMNWRRTYCTTGFVPKWRRWPRVNPPSGSRRISRSKSVSEMLLRRRLVRFLSRRRSRVGHLRPCPVLPTDISWGAPVWTTSTRGCSTFSAGHPRPPVRARTNAAETCCCYCCCCCRDKRHEWSIFWFSRRWSQESGQVWTLVVERRSLHDHTRPGRDIPHDHHWKSSRVSTKIILLSFVLLHVIM